MEEQLQSLPRSIEFFGLPGSGKSTVEVALMKRLQQSGFRVHRLRVLADRFRSSWRSPKRYWASWYGIRRLGYFPPLYGQTAAFFPSFSADLLKFKISVSDTIERAIPGPVGRTNMELWLRAELFAFHAWKESEVSERDGDILLADEGFLQRLAALYATGSLSKFDLEELLWSRPQFSRAVFLDINPIESLRRKSAPPFGDKSLHNEIEKHRGLFAEGVSEIWEKVAPAQRYQPEMDHGLDDVVSKLESDLFSVHP